MSTTKQLLEEFRDMGSPSSLDLKGGQHYEGYILEVGDEYLLFGVGGPEAPEEPVRIPVEEIEPGSLSYWDEIRSSWMHARWDEISAAWSHTPYRPPAVQMPDKGRPWWRFWS